MPSDAWGNEVSVSSGYLHYRHRSIDTCMISEIKAKGKRVFINYYRENKNCPKMCIICKDIFDATYMYNCILEDINTTNTEESFNIWSFLGCSRKKLI